MAAMTDYLSEALILHVLDNTTFTSPSGIYMALFTTGTTSAGGGSEVFGGSYARVSPAFTFTDNVAEMDALSFTDLPSCVVVAAAFFDALTSGNMLLHGALPASRTVAAGGTLSFTASDVAIMFK